MLDNGSAISSQIGLWSGNRMSWNSNCFSYTQGHIPIFSRSDGSRRDAELIRRVEHDLAKVGVASSSLVFRSKRLAELRGFFVCGLEPGPAESAMAVRYVRGNR